MKYFIKTPEGRYGPFEETQAVQFCLDGSVPLDASVEEVIFGGTREMELYRFPRLHQAVIERLRSSTPRRVATCPECKSDVFGAESDSAFVCKRCDTEFEVDAGGNSRVVRTHRNVSFWIGTVSGVLFLILGKVSRGHPKPVLNAVWTLSGAVLFTNTLFFILRRGVMWPRYGGAMTFQLRPALFTSWVVVVLFCAVVFTVLFGFALFSLFRS